MTKLSSSDRGKMPARSFAFEAARKEPIENAVHVRNAIARFTEVEGVTEAEREVAWQRILAAARLYNVVVQGAAPTAPRAASPSKRHPPRR